MHAFLRKTVPHVLESTDDRFSKTIDCCVSSSHSFRRNKTPYKRNETKRNVYFFDAYRTSLSMYVFVSLRDMSYQSFTVNTYMLLKANSDKSEGAVIYLSWR